MRQRAPSLRLQRIADNKLLREGRVRRASAPKRGEVRKSETKTIGKNVRRASCGKSTTQALRTEMQKTRLFTFTRDQGNSALIDVIRAPDQVQFLLLYLPNDAEMKVSVRNQRELVCSCMDFRHRAKRAQVNCKHILFIKLRVLKLPEGYAANNMIPDWPIFEASLDNIRFDYLAQNLLNPEFHVPQTKKFDEEDVCPICYNELEKEDKLSLVNCPNCRGVAHLHCVMAWLRNAPDRGCVFCKDDVIGRYIKMRKEMK
jgi:hypothetical protein